MYRILSLLTDCFSVLIIVIPVLLIKFKIKDNITKKSLLLLFSAYIAALFSLVGIPSITYLKFEPVFNIIPLADIIQSPKSAVLNVILFIPLGIFIRLLWKNKYDNAFKTIINGFILSLFIETLQIFTFRLTDINDLITNTLGTFIGWTLCKYILRNKRFTPSFEEDTSMGLWLTTAFVFITSFFISPFISDLIWNMIL